MNSCSGGSSWTPPLPFLKTLFFLFILISFFVSITSSSYSESTESEHFITPDGKYVYIDDDKVYLKATYHVTHGQAIEHSAMTKQYTGDCDFAIGFDGEVAWPKKVLLDDPHYIYQETENTETFYYVSNFEQTEDTPDYGNSYNSLKYKFDHKVLTDVGDPDGYVWIDVYDTVAYFDSQDSEGNNYTITWDTIHSQFEQYTDVSDRILSNPIEYEFDGKNLWYVTKNIYMTAGEMRNIIIEMESKIEFGENSYKYDIIWKPSHQSISEANAAGNLYILDPYWNTSWNNRISNQLPDGKRPYLYSLNISNDVGTNNATHIFGNGDFNSNYSDIVMAFDDGTIIQHAIEDNSSDPTILWANVTTNGTVHIYFNNSEAVDSSDYSGIVSGGVVSGSNGKIIQSFLSNGSFSPFDSFDVECLVVAGGGGGGTNTGGGGGAGGLLYNVSYAVSLQTYDIKVGAGGVKDDNGGNSVFSTLTAIGGGGGQGGADGLDGGSGGGGGHYATWDGGSGVAGQGHDGGDGVDYNSGGGGGAGQVGDNADSANSGDGGNGLAYSISGSSTYYAGGGGGGADTFRSDNPGSGGLGGGGNGGDSSVGYPGTVNTGGGGGGGSNRPTPMAGGTGGSGIVIIRYDNSGTWSTWSETQYYTDSLHYNATSPYNFTIESDSTLTSNRSIIPADDTNDTALSTGTSYLIINVFDNDATIVRNFTFIGDNLDWYQAANLSGSYDLKNTGGIIETQSNGNFTTNLVAGTYWIEEEVLAVNYSIDKNETITYTDTIYITKTVAAVNYSIDKSDTITLTDSVSLTKTVAAVNYSIDNSDTITITDTISITKTVAAINYSINTSDTITYTDSVFLTKTAASINYTSNVSDTIIFTDSVSLTKTVAAVNYSIDKNDTITISDSITLTKTTASINYSIDKSDTITYTDSVSLTKTTASVLYTTNISDTIAITDSVEFTKTSAPIGYNVSISDTITLTDSVTITKTTAGINY
ncbi:MAG: hypothetical protein KAS66_14350, partial [Candidatus Omnitrophica bacterium]|nr:hypothetical protein [Candidatus Omnitrophota bacterium]